MLVWGPPLCNTFRISHNGQLPVSPAFISSMCHWTVKPKDTWHHMFPCAVMTAPSAAFMAAGLWRLSDQGHVQASIRAAGRSLPCLPDAAFTRLTPLWCMHSQCAAILKKNACRLEFTTKSKRGTEKKEARGKMYEQWSEDREQRRERCRMRRWRQRERERETRKTKGMWSSPSLCLAALWLKQRAPGERGGSRPAQSVLSLPWSPACRPQKHTAKPSGRAPFYCAGSPIGSKESAKQAQIVMAQAPLNLKGRRSALDELLPGSWRRFLMF